MEEVIRNENLNYSNIIREKSRITSIHGNIVKKSQKYSIKYIKKIFKYLISIIKYFYKNLRKSMPLII